MEVDDSCFTTKTSKEPVKFLNFAGAVSKKTNENDNEGWTKVQSRSWHKRKKRKSENDRNSRITGQRKLTDGVFKSSAKTVDIFIGNVDKSTTCDSICDYIVNNFDVTPLDVLKLDIQTDSYNCFKVKIYMNDKDALFNGNLWPAGIVINKFDSKKSSFNKSS